MRSIGERLDIAATAMYRATVLDGSAARIAG